MTTYISRPYVLFLTAISYTFLFLKADLFINQALGKFSLWIVPAMFILFWVDIAFNKHYRSKRSHTVEVLTLLVSITIFFCFVIPILFASAFLDGTV